MFVCSYVGVINYATKLGIFESEDAAIEKIKSHLPKYISNYRSTLKRKSQWYNCTGCKTPCWLKKVYEFGKTL